MKTPRLCRSKWIATLALAIGLFAPALSRAQTTYTLTKLVDSNTAIPDRPGITFDLYDNKPVIGGDTVGFYDSDGGGYDENSGALWSIPDTGSATPLRLVDAATTAPGNSGPFTSAGTNYTENLVPDDLDGGYLAFTGISPEGLGYYSVPAAGGTVATLANTKQSQPNTPQGTPFEFLSPSLQLLGGEFYFATGFNDYGYGQGVYEIPVTGGSYTTLGDQSTPITGDPLGERFAGGDESFVGADANTIAFQTTEGERSISGSVAIYTAPITGLTVDTTTGFANNATRVVGDETLIPGDPQGRTFDTRFMQAAFDSSGAVVFTGSPSDLSYYGIYTSINGVVSRLVDDTTSLPGDTGHFTTTVGIFVPAVSNGVVAFTGGYIRADGTQVNGVYTVPVGGGPISTVVDDSQMQPDGSSIEANQLSSYALSTNGKLVFSASVTASDTQANAIFVATPGGAISGAGTLILSTHTGGDTGSVTLNVTTAPGTPAIESGATFKLSASGMPDIAGSNAQLNAAGTAYVVTFDLSGKADSLYDLVLTNADGSSITQAGAFTVEPGAGPIIYGDIIARATLRAGKPQVYTFLVGNRGDVDASTVPIFISFPSYFTASLVTPLATLPNPTDSSGQTYDLTQVPLVQTNGDHQLMSLIVPRVDAGSIRTVQVLFSCPDIFQYAHVPFTLSLNLGEPLLDAETGMPSSVDSGVAVNGLGEHEAKVGVAVTCLASLFNLATDCLSIVVPSLKVIECGPSIILAGENIYSNLASDNTDETQVLSVGQSIATGIVTAAGCLVEISPGVGTVINTIQCCLDAYLLEENCISPAVNLLSSTIVSGDPNDLVGSQGDGSAKHYLTGAQPLRYSVYFENEATASAAAQTVTITNPLDANLDLSTFSLGPINFGTTVLNPPAGTTSYTTTVDLRPATDLLVQVTANMDASTRILTYNFQSLDPATNQPTTDPSLGFLPPNVNAPEGDGFAIYYAQPKAGLATGTAINEQASIVFDANPAIATPTWLNTIDNDPPVSTIAALPSPESKSRLKLKLTSSDKGSGVGFYNIYVSEDGGAFQPLIKNAPGPKIVFDGVTGNKYAFFSQAVDLAGNIEPLKTAAEAKTKIVGADLIGSWNGAVSEKTAASGKTKLKGQFIVMNQSKNQATDAGSVVRFYLCDSATLDGTQVAIGRDAPFGVISGGGSVNVSLSGAKLDSGTAVSGKYVIAVIDPENLVTETDKTNDQVSYGPLP